MKNATRRTWITCTPRTSFTSWILNCVLLSVNTNHFVSIIDQLCHNKKIQERIFNEVSIDDFEDENVKKIYEYILKLKEEYDINKIDILSKLKDEELIKELTEIIYIDTQNIDNEKLLNDVLTYKHKEKLYNRRDEILKRLEENISKDEQDILQFELNQIIIEISRLKS